MHSYIELFGWIFTFFGTVIFTWDVIRQNTQLKKELQKIAKPRNIDFYSASLVVDYTEGLQFKHPKIAEPEKADRFILSSLDRKHIWLFTGAILTVIGAFLNLIAIVIQLI